MDTESDRPAAAPAAAAVSTSVPGTVMARWSLEATLPKPEEIDEIAAIVPPGTEVFLSTLPHVSLDRQVEAAGKVRAAGLEPVPHIAARYFEDESALRALLARLEEAAGIRRILLIAGDAGDPRGPFDSALSVIRAGIFAGTPVERVGVAGYPDGHPQISQAVLDEALAGKLAALAGAGLAAEVVSQFCFDARAIAGWIDQLRARWPEVPVRVGMAGPTSPRTLMRYAARCGVRTSLSSLPQRLSMVLRLLKSVAPAPIIRHLDANLSNLSPAGPLTAHFFSFGGLARTARWAHDMAARPTRP